VTGVFKKLFIITMSQADDSKIDGHSSPVTNDDRKTASHGLTCKVLLVIGLTKRRRDYGTYDSSFVER